ncbi:MAG TPA: class I SAM-dependent methyltransferase [Thermoanaerobaculia bacterium]|nr:class I SAM-dependent methyltransferase [Thermoanaerobaculia bacterium]
MTTRTEDLPTLLARIPDPVIRALFTPEFILCAEHFDRFTVDMILNAVRDLELSPALERGATVAEVVAAKGYAPRAAIPLDWFFRKLAAEEYLVADLRGAEPSFRARGPLSAGDPDRAESQARAVDPRSIPPFSVVRALAEHIPAFLRGEKTGEEILFSPTKLPLWFDYFSNDNLLYAINNRLGAEAVLRALPASRASEIVEIGGGSGSAALALFERLARDAALHRVGRYRFSEIVPTFLRRAERTIRGRYPDLPIEFKRVDMDRDLSEQGIPLGAADIVYAVNTVHIAHDLGATLARIREALKPGGAAVFSECVRPFPGQPIYVEFVFNFLENFTGVATDPLTRPNHGFLTPENWRRALAAAGFVRVEILPDVENLARHYEAFFVAAVSARRPG